MKSVLLSIQPKWCELIVSGEKTVEVRKTVPKLEAPFKCYIYCTTKEFDVTVFDWLGRDSVRVVKDGQGMIIGEFVCDKIYAIKNCGSRFMIGNDTALTNRIAEGSCLEFSDLRAYLKDKDGYAWHIADLKIYDKPKELGEFKKAIACEEGEHCFGCTNGFLLPGGGCRLKAFTRAPQSWCYVEG